MWRKFSVAVALAAILLGGCNRESQVTKDANIRATQAALESVVRKAEAIYAVKESYFDATVTNLTKAEATDEADYRVFLTRHPDVAAAEKKLVPGHSALDDKGPAMTFVDASISSKNFTVVSVNPVDANTFVAAAYTRDGFCGFMRVLGASGVSIGLSRSDGSNCKAINAPSTGWKPA